MKVNLRFFMLSIDPVTTLSVFDNYSASVSFSKIILSMEGYFVPTSYIDSIFKLQSFSE